MKTWQIQEAKTNLKDLIHYAKSNPQLITVEGHEEVVVMSVKKYYSEFRKFKPSIVDVMQKFPHKELKLTMKRPEDSNQRNINL